MHSGKEESANWCRPETKRAFTVGLCLRKSLVGLCLWNGLKERASQLNRFPRYVSLSPRRDPSSYRGAKGKYGRRNEEFPLPPEQNTESSHCPGKEGSENFQLPRWGLLRSSH